MQCCCDLASCRGLCLGFPLFPFIGTVSCALLHMRACSQKKGKSKLGKLHGARYLVCPSFSLFSRYASPRPRQDTCTAFPCSSTSYLPVCFFFLSLPSL